jgi:hypothetical protein
MQFLGQALTASSWMDVVCCPTGSALEQICMPPETALGLCERVGCRSPQSCWWAQLRPLQSQWRQRREVVVRATTTLSHSYCVGVIINCYLECNVNSVCHAELLNFLARHGQLHTYKLSRLPSNIFLYGTPLQRFSWLPCCITLSNPFHATWSHVCGHRKSYAVSCTRFPGKDDLWPTIRMWRMRMSWRSYTE